MLSRQITLADINDTILFKPERRDDLNTTLTSNVAYDITPPLDPMRTHRGLQCTTFLLSLKLEHAVPFQILSVH